MVSPGDLLDGKYLVERLLGFGGYGRVYAAVNQNLRKQVAIKLTHCRDADGRFWREAQAAAQLSSPHTVRVFDVDVLEDGTSYIVMELLEGQSLRDYLRDHGRVPLQQALSWTVQICHALGEAHAAGLVHRDIKPSNLFIVEEPNSPPLIKLLDFGLARTLHAAPDDRVTKSGVVIGSPMYMSPEQLRSAPLSRSTDLWSLGVVLYEMLTGRKPFPGPNNEAILAAIAADPPTPIHEADATLPPGVQSALARCLRKHPDERFASAAELAQCLQEAASGAVSETLSAVSNDELTVESGLFVHPSALDSGALSTTVRTGRRRTWLALGLPLLTVIAAVQFFWTTPLHPGTSSQTPRAPTESAVTLATERARQSAPLSSQPAAAFGASSANARISPHPTGSGQRVTSSAPQPAKPRPRTTSPHAATKKSDSLLFKEPDF